MERCDVAVVGAGLAGLTCARLLAERNLAVILADRKQRVDQGVHTTGIFVRKTLEDFALPADCLGPAVRDVVLESPGGRQLRLASRHDEFRVGRMEQLYRRLLNAGVRRSVRWRPGHRLTNCEPLGGDTVLRFETRDGARYVRARFVIGADGARSTVARDLCLERNRRWIVGVEDVFEATGLARTARRPIFHCFVDPELAPGYLCWVVDDGEYVHVGLGGHPESFNPATNLERFRERISDRFGLSDRSPKQRRAGRIPIGGILSRLAQPRGLLAGDAAGAVSPLTAGGLDPALRLSELAVDTAARFLGTGNPAVLADYCGDRFRPRLVSRLLMRRLFDQMTHPRVIETAFSALAHPPGLQLARHVFFGRGSFPEIPRAARGPRLLTEAPPVE